MRNLRTCSLILQQVAGELFYHLVVVREEPKDNYFERIWGLEFVQQFAAQLLLLRLVMKAVVAKFATTESAKGELSIKLQYEEMMLMDQIRNKIKIDCCAEYNSFVFSTKKLYD